MALEQELRVGDALYGFGFQIAMSGGKPGLVSVGVVDATMKVKRVTMTIKKRFLAKNKQVAFVEHRDVSFRWLPWVSGKINYGDLQGKDILSGMFTGCWMAVYTEGNTRVCHIATQTDDGDCKAAWRAHKARKGISNVKEFRPDLELPGALNLGLVTSTSELYKIQLTGEKEVSIPNPWRTVEEWMDPKKGKQTREFATILAAQDEVDATQIYGGFNYRILKIVGPLQPGVFPTS
jgi:hypothetical protein